MSKQMMKAVRIHDYGGLDALTFEDAPRPEPQSGQVLVHMRATGVNPADSGARNGAFKQWMPLQFPWTPGLEGAGTIEAIGEGVSALQVGQDVYGFVSGGYAQYAVASPNELQAKPANLDWEAAASAPMGTSMAWAAVIETAKVEEGQAVLIHGAAGGIGSYATQLAHWKKAFVIGVTSKANQAFVKSLGAQLVIDYTEAPFETVVQDVDVVIDTVGGDTPARSWGVMSPGGILVTVAGRLAEDAGKAQGVRAASVRRPTFGDHTQITQLLESRVLVPTVRAVFPLAEARKAQELCETRHGRGRIVLQIPE